MIRSKQANGQPCNRHEAQHAAPLVSVISQNQVVGIGRCSHVAGALAIVEGRSMGAYKEVVKTN